MEYKFFDKIDYKLSHIGIDTSHFSGSTSWYDNNKKDSIKIIREAINTGINFIDTASIYGLGQSEIIVGEALSQINRDEVFLATKAGFIWDEKNEPTINLSEQSIYSQIELSLRRLNVEYVDLYQIHWPDHNIDIRETIETLAKLQEKGYIKHIGVCNLSLGLLKEANKIADIVSYQGIYNLIEQNGSSLRMSPITYKSRDEIIPYIKEEDMFFIPYCPFVKKILSDQKVLNNNTIMCEHQLSSDKLQKYKKYIHEITKNIDRPISEIALSWLIKQESIGPVKVKISSIEQLHKYIKTVENPLTDEEFEYIDSIKY